MPTREEYEKFWIKLMKPWWGADHADCRMQESFYQTEATIPELGIRYKGLNSHQGYSSL